MTIYLSRYGAASHLGEMLGGVNGLQHLTLTTGLRNGKSCLCPSPQEYEEEDGDDDVVVIH